MDEDALRQLLAGTRVKDLMYHGTSKSFTEFDPGKLSERSLFGPGFYFTDNPGVASDYAKKQSGMEIVGNYLDEPSAEKAINELLAYYNPKDKKPIILKHSIGLSPHVYEAALVPQNYGPSVHPAHLNIKNPLNMDARPTRRSWDQMGMKDLGFGDWGFGVRQDFKSNSEILDYLVRGEAQVPNYELPEIFQTHGVDGLLYRGGRRTGGVPHKAAVVWDIKNIIPALKKALLGIAGGPFDGIFPMSDGGISLDAELYMQDQQRLAEEEWFRKYGS